MYPRQWEDPVRGDVVTGSRSPYPSVWTPGDGGPRSSLGRGLTPRIPTPAPDSSASPLERTRVRCPLDTTQVDRRGPATRHHPSGQARTGISLSVTSTIELHGV